MFRRLIDEANSLVRKLETTKVAVTSGRSIASLPRSDRVEYDEFDEWLRSSPTLIVEVFGEGSVLLSQWKDLRRRLSEQTRSEALQGRFDELDASIKEINLLKAHLQTCQDVYDARASRLQSEGRSQVTYHISGGNFVGAQIGGVANSMSNYINELKLGEYSNDDEKRLKESLAELRQAIETAPELSVAEKNAAATDLALLTEELVKREDQQDAGPGTSFGVA